MGKSNQTKGWLENYNNSRKCLLAKFMNASSNTWIDISMDSTTISLRCQFLKVREDIIIAWSFLID
jgi:hypothetical protein